jgi:L-aspartate oxidase
VKSYDVIVVGSGIAGLFTAIKAAETGRVVLVTKSQLEESNTRYAQGGIAAATFVDDDPALHMQDTLTAGAGLCDEEAVRILCTEGPDRINELLRLGVDFDSQDGELKRGLEAAHSRARVLHAGGDATGAHIERALVRALRAANVDVYEHTYLVDLVVQNHAVTGVSLLQDTGLAFSLHAFSVVLATGGAGQLYRHTTNPAVATGDGVAAAFRAGALIADLEFYQFHPTALAVGDTFLVSEAVRGEGAVLRNASGEAFMTRYDQRADLAPRDVVARAIATEMLHQDGEPVTLDATTMSGEFLSQRFPTINNHLRSLDIDWSRSWVPVTPAAHYWMGGVRTDTWGRTSLAGLFAVGEAACTGVHGANRLASNSLLEGIVFGGRVVRHLVAPGEANEPTFVDDVQQLHFANAGQAVPDKSDVRDLMWANVGLIRDKGDLETAYKQLQAWSAPSTLINQEQHELRNLITLGRIVAAAALAREESRGAHFRSDFNPCDPSQQRHRAFTR